MESIQLNYNDNFMEYAPNSPPSFPDISNIVGDPQLSPRLGREYQVEVPSMIKETERFRLQMNPADSEVVHDISLSFADNDGSTVNVIKPAKASGVKRRRNSGQGNKNKSYIMAPGTLSCSWSDADAKSFLLGLFIFGKAFIKIKRFLENKRMGEILSFYYGKFYKSDEYRRWSSCRKLKGRKCLIGEKLFTRRRRQELLSRLLPRVSEESQDTLLKVSKSYTEGRVSLEEYISSLKSTVGLGVLVEAVGIGKEKEDLTSLHVEPRKNNRVFPAPTSKDWASLSPNHILKYLTGRFRLSKAKSNNLFWEAVWPRLLARGWHSEQPKNQGYARTKDYLVFLTPGVKKFSRRKLVKGRHYFDCVTDVLSKVVAEPNLLELEEEAEAGSSNDEEPEKGPNEDHQSDSTPGTVINIRQDPSPIQSPTLQQSILPEHLISEPQGYGTEILMSENELQTSMPTTVILESDTESSSPQPNVQTSTPESTNVEPAPQAPSHVCDPSFYQRLNEFSAEWQTLFAEWQTMIQKQNGALEQNKVLVSSLPTQDQTNPTAPSQTEGQTVIPSETQTSPITKQMSKQKPFPFPKESDPHGASFPKLPKPSFPILDSSEIFADKAESLQSHRSWKAIFLEFPSIPEELTNQNHATTSVLEDPHNHTMTDQEIQLKPIIKLPPFKPHTDGVEKHVIPIWNTVPKKADAEQVAKQRSRTFGSSTLIFDPDTKWKRFVNPKEYGIAASFGDRMMYGLVQAECALPQGLRKIGFMPHSWLTSSKDTKIGLVPSMKCPKLKMIDLNKDKDIRMELSKEETPKPLTWEEVTACEEVDKDLIRFWLNRSADKLHDSEAIRFWKNHVHACSKEASSSGLSDYHKAKTATYIGKYGFSDVRFFYRDDSLAVPVSSTTVEEDSLHWVEEMPKAIPAAAAKFVDESSSSIPATTRPQQSELKGSSVKLPSWNEEIVDKEIKEYVKEKLKPIDDLLKQMINLLASDAKPSFSAS